MFIAVLQVLRLFQNGRAPDRRYFNGPLFLTYALTPYIFTDRSFSPPGFWRPGRSAGRGKRHFVQIRNINMFYTPVLFYIGICCYTCHHGKIGSVFMDIVNNSANVLASISFPDVSLQCLLYYCLLNSVLFLCSFRDTGMDCVLYWCQLLNGG